MPEEFYTDWGIEKSFLSEETSEFERSPYFPSATPTFSEIALACVKSSK